MSFAKSAGHASPDALYEFSIATSEYREACKIYTRIRMAADSDYASETDIVAHHRAKVAFKRACKEYSIARNKYIAIVRAAAYAASSLSNRDILDITVETSDRAITEEIRKNAFVSKLSPEKMQEFTGDFKAELRKLRGLAPDAPLNLPGELSSVKNTEDTKAIENDSIVNQKLYNDPTNTASPNFGEAT